MRPEEKQVMRIASMADFYAFRDTLNLTDRQKEIFNLRYSRGLLMQDIVKEIGFSYDIILEDMKDIRQKLVAILKE